MFFVAGDELKVLVTGAAGFIGSHVVDAFVDAGAKIIGLDSLDAGVHHHAPDYLRSDVDYCFSDLRWWQPDDRFYDVEMIVHLAALGGVSRASREPANIIEANCGGTARLLAAARTWPKLCRTLLAGSFSVYGANYQYRCPQCSQEMNATRLTEDLERGVFDVICTKCGTPAEVLPITEATPPSPLETYGASKYMQELCFRGFDHGEQTILRFSSVYGTRLRLDDGEATIIAKLASWIRNGESPSLFEDGRQIRDWVYVGDLVAAVMALANGASAPPVVNVCAGVPTTLAEACRYIADAVGKSCVPKIVGGYRPGDMRHCLGDNSRFRELILRAPLPPREGLNLAFAELSEKTSSAAQSVTV